MPVASRTVNVLTSLGIVYACYPYTLDFSLLATDCSRLDVASIDLMVIREKMKNIGGLFPPIRKQETGWGVLGGRGRLGRASDEA